MSHEERSTIEARLAEEEYYSPNPEFIGQANVSDRSVYDRFDEFPDGFEEYAELLDWDEHWTDVLDASNPPFYDWFVGGKLNASYNCIDRHLDAHRDKTAIIWEGEPGDSRRLAYQDLYREVNEFAAMFRDAGIGADDVVTFHLPVIPELPIGMLAAARIGAPHSVVFGGFTAAALANRLDDANSRYLVTIDGYYRRGKFLDHKQKADEAVEQASVDVDTVFVLQREKELHPETKIVEGRDVVVEDVRSQYRGAHVEPVPRASDDILFLMYTSGTTGKPKGAQHGTGGYLSYVAGTSKYLFDIHSTDTYWCLADIGWITGHSYMVYGPLLLGATSMMYEGAPDHPHKGYIWELAEKHAVDIFHTSPTAVRMFMKWGETHLEPYDFEFKLLVSVGEPIQPEVWRWYYDHVGRGDTVIIDTWWQTETGGVVMSNLPALADMKPGSVGHPMPGIQATVLDDDGNEIEPGTGTAGNLVLTRPWPGILQTLYGDDERYISEYWEKFSDLESRNMDDWIYRTGDGAVEAADGYFRILGRLDDVMNVSGHRLGSMELESTIVEVPAVAEAAVVARDDPVKGQVPDAYVVLKEGVEPSDDLREAVVASVAEGIGKFARPAHVEFVDALPYTKSGKIMRRLLSDISNDRELSDTTTLEDPSVPEQIRRQVQGA
ncbi:MULTISPECIES: acetate--CoA ligase [Haloferax]|uniref:Acetate--CoA ligase n=1 Tax=Haloferax marinum TaxID=2666143 RepID=A0A6A8G711_9EURY|nr:MULTISPECIES: acetate--CoA ligase [Haloferax]KAB1197847.1 acetate--CoA ligase [Haloferax sp. CBA1150]MRW96909.1 acetate--CoA ligase [Haloferax marinum]